MSAKPVRINQSRPSAPAACIRFFWLGLGMATMQMESLPAAPSDAFALTTTPSTAGVVQVEDQRASARPSSNRAEILKRFVEECVLITPGRGVFPNTYRFGAAAGETFGAEPRDVEMPSDFRISRYEVTQELYEAVMDTNPSRWKGPRNSAESMTIGSAESFCQKLTEILRREKLIGVNEEVRLPTEVEWEYCCRAGTATRYSFGDQAAAPDDRAPKATLLDPYAWHTGNAAGNDPAVGVLKPNPWGLFDCHGYLWEYVSDAWTINGQPAKPGNAPISARPVRVARGGSWKDESSRLTSSSRMPISEVTVDDAVGFRCLIAKKPATDTR